MAKTFYSYEKRQKELAKQKKKEEKRLRKLEQKQQKNSDEQQPVDIEDTEQASE